MGIVINYLINFLSKHMFRVFSAPRTYDLIGKIIKIIDHKIVNIFYPSFLTYVLGTQKNCLIEIVLLSAHNICFG